MPRGADPESPQERTIATKRRKHSALSFRASKRIVYSVLQSLYRFPGMPAVSRDARASGSAA
jgi:hypothetical protein